MPLRGDRPNGTASLAGLIDRLINRFGADNVYRVAPVESDVPGTRRSPRRPPLAPPTAAVLADHPAAAGAPA